jgi:hypothetical protein
MPLLELVLLRPPQRSSHRGIFLASSMGLPGCISTRIPELHDNAGIHALFCLLNHAVEQRQLILMPLNLVSSRVRERHARWRRLAATLVELVLANVWAPSSIIIPLLQLIFGILLAKRGGMAIVGSRWRKLTRAGVHNTHAQSAILCMMHHT